MATENNTPRRGCMVGLLTLLVGVGISWGLAVFAIRDMPERRDVSDALYWDGLWLEWCCGGNLLALLAACLAAGWASRRKNEER